MSTATAASATRREPELPGQTVVKAMVGHWVTDAGSRPASGCVQMRSGLSIEK